MLARDEELNSKIAMAEDGYGTVYISGELGGERRTISTRDAPIIALAPPDDQSPEAVLQRLTETITKILERFTR